MADAPEKTYLELSEAGAGSHKFYEVVVDGTELRIRFGRIGDPGQTSTSQFPTADKARAEAQKKIREKVKKGYEAAVMGARGKRTVTRRETPVVAPVKAAKAAPLLWTFDTGNRAFGIFVDDSLCWVGNEDGKIFALDHTGKVQFKAKLPDGVKCIIADEDWLYAGCDDGNVYDLSGKVPRVAYRIEPDLDIYWLDIHAGVLAVSDASGKVTVVNHEDESQWSKQSGGKWGWMVRCDEIGVYHGHSAGITMYDWEDGKQIWERPTDGAVFFGWQEDDTVYAGTTHQKVCSFTKQGEPSTVYSCDSVIFSCATAAGGKYVFAGDNASSIYCFGQDGKRLWKLGTGCGAALSMQFDKKSDRLFIVTSSGAFGCIDASEAAIQAAQQGVVPKTVAYTAPRVEEAPAAPLETTRDSSGGVIAECYADGGKLRVRIVSPGYDRRWHCQFPKDLREAGARYLIDQVRASSRGGFYRALGNIRKLVA